MKNEKMDKSFMTAGVSSPSPKC